MCLDDYLVAKFPNLELKPPLFYHWPISIRFALGVNWKRACDYPNSPYLIGCYKRAITLFEAVHSPVDDIIVVVDVNDYQNGKNVKNKLNNYWPYIDKSLLIKLSDHVIPYAFTDEDAGGIYRTHRFSLKCKVSDFRYTPLLKAICNHDLGIKPRAVNRVYFVNMSKNSIFHIYDDRGCDLLATSTDTIKSIYYQYNDWILEHDRIKIDKLFK